MPIKRQNLKDSRRKIRKKSKKSTIILYVVSAIVVIMLLIGYIIFKNQSVEVTTKNTLKTTERTNSIEEPRITTVSEEIQAAVANARLRLETIDNKDVLRVVIEKTYGINEREITYKYEWSLNGQPAGTGSDSLSGLKRGDNVAVTITPFDGEKPGKARRLIMDVENATPKVSESKEPKYDGKIFTAQIVASDPDGDTLSYELLNGPEGMTIDKKNGIVTWPVQANGSGEYPVSVKITDGHGGEITYQMTATIPKELPPPAQVNKKTP